MEIELRDSEAEANEVISQWQGSCAAAESKCASLEEELRHLNAAKDTDVDEGACIEVDTLAQKEEELRRSNEEAESMKSLMQKLKGKPYICLLRIFSRSFLHHTAGPYANLFILLRRRSTRA